MIPSAPFRGEEFLFALLLRMVLEHCSTMVAGELNDYGIEAHAEAMQALAGAGFIEITEQTDDQTRAIALPAAAELIARLRADRQTVPRE